MAQLIHGTTINGHIAIHAGNMSDHAIATTSYVTTQINNLINGAPGALDTLNELAAALGNDASFSSTLTNSLAAKLSLSGGTLTGKVLFPSAVSNRPQFPGGILGLDTGDGNFDIWGISRDYYPSHSNASNAWGLRWNGDNNDFEFVGGGSNRVILDMDGGNLTASGIVYASGGNSGNWNTAYGWGNHASAGYLTALPSHNHDDRYYTESESDSRYLRLSGGTLTGDLLSTHPLYPGYNNGAVGSQGSYYIYGNVSNSGIRTNGNFLANGDIYLGTRGQWLSTYLNQNVRTDSAPSFSSVYLGGSQLTGTQVNGLSNMLGVTTLPYSCDITVGGDPDRFYAVQFWGGDQDVWRRIIIKRGYGETAPWDPIGTGVHHGGLLLDWEGNFGGWGGAEYADRIRVFNESYTNVCADMFIYSHSMGYVFMLRGGGAVYHIFSDQAINGYYQSGSPDILYNSSTLSYDDNWSGTNQYDVYAPEPLTLAQVNSSRIDGLRTKKQSLLDGRYLRQGVDIGSISNITASNNISSLNFLATNAYYLNGTSYYLNSTNGGIYTNARFESASTIYASGGNSSQWNTAYGWGNHASAGYQSASTAITTSNIGSQSVNYAASAGSVAWTNVSSRPTALSQFTNDLGNYGGFLTSLPSHTHDDRYYTESESDGRYLYYRGVNQENDFQRFQDTAGEIRFDQINDYNNLSNAPGGYTYGGVLSMRGANFGFQLWGSHTGDFYYKTQWSDDQHSGWRQVITSLNIGSQSVAYASQVGINYNNNSNANYQLLWGSGNSVYGTAEVYVNPSNDHIYASGFYANSDIYLGTRGTWLSSWLNQSVQTGASPSFANVYLTGIVGNNSSQTRDKLRVWDSSQYTIGMKSGYDYGHLGNDEYAMSFQMNDNSGRGFWWGDTGHSDDQGAASLTTDGRMVIAKSLSIGEGETSTTPSSTTLYVRGQVDGSEVLAVDGVNGRLFTVTDSVLDTIYSVNTIAGLPILEIMANNTVKIGKYGANSITISNSRIAINSDTVDTNFPFYVSDRSTSASRYTLANPGMGFNLADAYAQLQLYGTSGAYIDFVTGANDYNGRIIWASSRFSITGAMWGDMYNASGASYATQSWVQSQGYLTSAGSYLPYGNWSGTSGLNDYKLYLRTNGDNNHYLWNAADDWEELNAYEGTGFRITSVGGTVGVLYVYGSTNGGYTYSPYSFRAPIFYDSDDTGYYGNFAGTSRLNELNLGTTNTRIRAMDGVGYLRIYGSASNYLAIGPSDNNGWIYFENSGNSNGIYFNTTNRYAFDTADVTPYTDAENSLGNGSYRWAQVYTSGWLRQYGAQGMYNQDYGTHFYSLGSASWAITGSGGVVELQFRSNHQSTIRGYVYADTSNNIGFLNNAGNWSLLTDSARSTTLYGNLTVGQGTGASSIFMHDSDEGTREIHCNSNRIGFLNQSGSWGSWCDDSGNWVTGAGMYAAAFYDNDNSAFYLDPAGSSRLRNLYVGDSGSNWSDPGGWGTQVWFSNGPHTRFTVEARTPGIQAGIYVHTPDQVYIGSYTGHNVSIMRGGNRRLLIEDGRVYSDVYMEAAGSMRAPIFYDSADTGYYLDPNDTSNLWRFTEGTLNRHSLNSRQTNSPWSTRSSQGTLYQTGAMGWGNNDLNVIGSNWGSGFFDTWGSPANGPGASGHYVGMQAFHYNNSDSSRFHGWQMACAQEADNRWFWRSAWDSPRSWVEMIHSGNIGSQSVNYAASAGSASSASSASSATIASTVTVNSGNGSASWYPILWHSGNNVYSSSGTAEIYPAGGYGRFQYINTTDNDESGITRFVIKNGDSYHRSATTTVAADIIRGVASGTWSITAARANRANGNFYIDDNYGNTVVGVYTSTRFQGVWAMGDSYKLAADGTSCANHYGIAWSHPNAGGEAANLTNHGMLVQNVGRTWTAISDTIWCIGDIIAYSDAKVKANIEVIDNPLERLSKVRGVTFTRTDLADPTKRYTGVIAQEMREALPEAVSENANGELSVSYGNTVSLLIESIKAQQVQIEELKAEVKKLKGE